jgi:hypothetical protein
MLLDQIDTLNTQVARLTIRIDGLLLTAEPRDDGGGRTRPAIPFPATGRPPRLNNIFVGGRR